MGCTVAVLVASGNSAGGGTVPAVLAPLLEARSHILDAVLLGTGPTAPAVLGAGPMALLATEALRSVAEVLRAARLAKRIAYARLAASAAEFVCGVSQMVEPVVVTFSTLARRRAAMRRQRLRMVVLRASACVFGTVSIDTMTMSISRSSALGLP